VARKGRGGSTPLSRTSKPLLAAGVSSFQPASRVQRYARFVGGPIRRPTTLQGGTLNEQQFSETAGELATEVLDAAERLVNVGEKLNHHQASSPSLARSSGKAARKR
jgi:hypothetical protein